MIRYEGAFVPVPAGEEWPDPRPLSVDPGALEGSGLSIGAIGVYTYGSDRYLMEVDPITKESTGRRQQFRLVASPAS